MSDLKNDVAWNYIFDKYKIVETIKRNGRFEITANQIKESKRERV